ncbi:HD domain-containing protein [Mesorhizobium sp. M0138]|uniref:HD domain-containing protein n=1 Tax=Mesorhizobium sp. M0138 TaxID=2956891 RepID=UPI00333D9B5E
MKTVSFTQMKDGTRDDYLMLHEAEKAFFAMTPDRILAELRRQGEETLKGYPITRLQHGLQSATRAEKDGADIDWTVGALLHDIGDGLAPQNHDRFAAEAIRPFVRWDVAWVVEHHGIFQMLYYAHHYGWDPNARNTFLDQSLLSELRRFL